MHFPWYRHTLRALSLLVERLAAGSDTASQAVPIGDIMAVGTITLASNRGIRQELSELRASLGDAVDPCAAI